MNRWGLPDDPVAIAATALAALLLLLRAGRRGPRSLSTRALLLLSAAIATALSLGYVEVYLRGGPRIIDATTYFLQARTYAAGQLGFSPPGPEASHIGRFLLPMPDGRLSAIFPPGYPALLALGFLMRAPLLVGPLLAAALTVGTYWLARAAFGDERVARLAAVMSVACAALRYHTADTMAHGWCALLGLACLLGLIHEDRRLGWLGGLCLGALAATRPVTALAIGSTLLLALPFWHSSWAERWARLKGFSLASIGIAAFLWQQYAVTGELWASSQVRYYELADAPGCYRWGLGASVGCPGEHGPFVAAHLPNGYGIVEAAATTLRRLYTHLSDAGNIELFGLALPVALIVGRRHRAVRLFGAAIALQIVLYAGFYFDGNYPGGGARMFADVLPLEHALLAWLATRVNLRAAVLPVMLVGFGVHTSFDHAQLADRDGGRPMYEATFARKRASEGALVFVQSDHGYALGHDPSRRDLLVVRHRADALDYFAWTSAGRPEAFRYEFDFVHPGSQPALVPYEPVRSSRFEMEHQWPPFALVGAAVSRQPGSRCEGWGLSLTSNGGVGRAQVSLWVERAGRQRVRARVSGDFALAAEGSAVTLEASLEPEPGCRELVGTLWANAPGNLRLWLETRDHAFIDSLELEPADPEPARSLLP